MRISSKPPQFSHFQKKLDKLKPVEEESIKAEFLTLNFCFFRYLKMGFFAFLYGEKNLFKMPSWDYWEFPFF